MFGCDICQEVCPYNVKANSTDEPSYLPRQGLYAPDLIALLSIDQEEFRRRFRGSPIVRAKRRGFLRNVAVALGNNGGPEAVPALTKALNDEEPLVRGHVAWALGRIGTSEALATLRQKLLSEANPEVKSEIEEALREASESVPDHL
jgi:epoxyqueuosine reductase